MEFRSSSRIRRFAVGLLSLGVAMGGSAVAFPGVASAVAPDAPTVSVTTGIGTITVTLTYAGTGSTATSMYAFAASNFTFPSYTGPYCLKSRTGSEASTSCTIDVVPGSYLVRASARNNASEQSTFASADVIVPGPPAVPALAQNCQSFGCQGKGQIGAKAYPYGPGYTRAQFTLTRNASFSKLGPYWNGGDVGKTFGFDPTSKLFYFTCDGSFANLGFHYALIKATEATKENCSTGSLNADNTLVAGSGSGSNKVGQDLGGLAFDSSGNVYVADRSNDRVAEWTKANTNGGGTGTTVAGTGTAGTALNQLNNPGQIVVDASGNLYVADSGNNRVLKFAAGSTSSTNGTVVAGGNGAGSNANQLSNPQGVAVDSTGQVYVADTDNCRVVRWAPGASVGTTVVGQNGCHPWGQLSSFTTQILLNESAKRLYIDEPLDPSTGAGYPTFGYLNLATGNYSQLWARNASWPNDWANREAVLDTTGQPVFRTGNAGGAGGGINRLDLTGGTVYCDMPIGKDVTDTYGRQATTCVGTQIGTDGLYWGDVAFVNSYGQGAHYSWGSWFASGWSKAPDVPSKPTLTPGFKALTIKWTPASTGEPANEYVVTLKDAKGATAGTCTATAPDTSCVVSGLDPKVKYTATVVAKNPVGSAKASPASDPAAPYDLPAKMVAPVGTALARSASVAFTPPSTKDGGPAFSYTVTAGPGGATCTVDAPATSCIVPGLDPGTHYTFTVAATNDGGTGPSSPASNDVVPFDNPSKPSKPTLTAGDGGVLVKGSVSSNDGGSPIIGYTATIYDGDGNVVGRCDYLDPAVGCSVPGLANGIAYTAKVVGHNVGGDSVPSDPSDPATPSGPPASPPNLHVTSTSDGTVDVAWDAPASNGGSSISGYVLTQFPAGGSCTVDSSARTAHCTGLTNGTSYDFSVAATNGSGTGPVSNVDTGTPMTVPSAPVAPTIKAGNGTVTVTWKKSASTGGSAIKRYTVTVGGKTCVTTGTSCTITGLSNGTAVSAVVKATNAVGDSVDSAASASVTPAAPAGAPSVGFVAPTITAGNGKLDVSLMDFSPGATGVIFTAGPGGQSCVAKAMPWKCTIPGVDNGTEYTVTAAFINAKGTGPQSDASNKATPLGPPSAPQSLVAKGANGSLKVSWAYPASDGGSAVTSYTVTVKTSKGKVAGTCTYTVVDPATNTCNVSGLSTSELYVVEVTATNAQGTGPKAVLTDVLAPIAFNSLTAPTPKMQVAVGDHGQVFRSSDAGAHWVVDATPTLKDLRSVSCGGGTFCMAVGDGGTILTWDAASSPTTGTQAWKVLDAGISTDLNGVFCIVDGACIAVGDSSTVAISDPQAAKAAPTTVKVNDVSDVIAGNVNAITCTNPKAPGKPACVIGGDGGKLVAVKWSGTAFSAPSDISVSGVSSDITALRCSVDTNCVAVGKAGLVLYGTKDITVAKSWKKLKAIKGFDGTADLRGVACPALSQLCIAVGTSGTILVSTPKKPAGPGTTGWVPLSGQVGYDLTNVRCVSTTACLGIGAGHLLQVVQDKKGKWAVRQVV